eukprot:c9475_g1_i1.p1 GENE.c9475_g1_i1~~c9475_g1_i1.p1  ORF type:complete len:138 (+),score=34.92 c9475_g1_i1:50-415(+)
MSPEMSDTPLPASLLGSPQSLFQSSAESQPMQDFASQQPAAPAEFEQQFQGMPFGAMPAMAPPTAAYPAPPVLGSGFPLMQPFASPPEPRTENFGALAGYPPRMPYASGAMQFEERGVGVF